MTSRSVLSRTQHVRGVIAVSVLAVAAACMASTSARAAEPAVGEVSLLIGAAKVFRKDGTVEFLKRGASIFVGDRVETSGNGHVHMRFIDNAAVSVRPESVLEVQAYHFDARNPETNEVRFKMEQGTGRSISGAATAQDKSRFRLNTPIAAIGVRGTDFIVQTDATGVRATVADGAIVVGALGANCSAAALGPCRGVNTSFLSAEMGRVMVELRPGEQVARVVPAVETLVVAKGGDERATARSAAESSARSAGMLAAEASINAQTRGNDVAAAEVLVLAHANLPENTAPPVVTQLMWGRYENFLGPVESASEKGTVASVGRPDEVTGTRAYSLYRAVNPADPTNTLLTTNEASVKFRLARSDAAFESNSGQKELAKIDGSALNIDFARRTFATSLAVSSVSGVTANVLAAGIVTPTGTFAATSKDASGAQNLYLIGATSIDGKEAGYLFERRVGGGLFTGRTLWGR